MTEKFVKNRQLKHKNHVLLVNAILLFGGIFLICGNFYKNSTSVFADGLRFLWENETVSDLKVYDENSADLQKDSEKLYAKIKVFLDDAKDVTEENFDDYCRNFIKNGGSDGLAKISVLSSDDFYDLQNSGKYFLLYRGIAKKQFAKDLRQGDVEIRGSGAWKLF